MSRTSFEDLDGDWEHELIDLEKEQTFEEKVELMEKLLDSESTLFSKKMRDWLIKDDVLDILISFVTRPPTLSKEEEQNGLAFEVLRSEEYVQSSNRRRDALLASEAEKKVETEQREGEDVEDEDEDFTFSKEAKRADKAAEVFVYQAASFPQDFIDQKLEHIVQQLFRVFHLNSEGDFDNFDKMFASLLGPYGAKVINIFLKNRKLLLHLLNYLHDPAINETLSGIFKAMLPEQILVNFFTALNEDGFWPALGQKIYGQGAESSFEDAGAFFVRLVEACATQPHADVLFSDLGRDPTFLDGLVAAIANQSGKTSHDQQVACITCLRVLLLKSGEQLFDTSLEAYTPTPIPNMLGGIHHALHDHLKTRAGSLAQKLLDDAQPKKHQQDVVFSTYRLSSRFTVSRIHLLEILVALAEQNPTDVLNSFPSGIWRVLSDWLFEHKFNNVYHELFYKLFRTMVKINHVDSIKSLLSRYKFLPRMIEHYKATNTYTTGLRSYLLFMGNHLRLKADTQPPTEILKNLLNSNQIWKEFLPTLRADTIAQYVTEFPASRGGHVPISPFASAESFGLYSSLAPMKPITPASVNIDIGSDYARSLGFEDKTPYIDQGKKKKKKKKRRNTANRRGTTPENGSQQGTSAGEPDRKSVV